VRRLIALALALAACAQPGLPPGGPPDTTPPRVVRVIPDSNALNVRRSTIVLDFDEVVSERPRGAASLSDLFILSPSHSPLSISWKRSRIELLPRGGLRPNTTYTLRLLPGLTDLAGNSDSTGLEVVFSTGPAIASAYIAGRVFDWLAARPAAHAYVEALALPDSARYATSADSSGAFAIRHMEPGHYLLRAVLDQNRNRRLDPRELFDSVTVELRDSLRRELLAALRDSLGPAIATVEVRDSLHLRVTLDRPLDTAFVLAPAIFSLKGADSAALPIREVLTQRDWERRLADSLARRDSTATRQDSLRHADSLRLAAGRVLQGAGRGAQQQPPLRPVAAIPATVLELVLESPLPSGTSFRLRAVGLRSISGAVRTSERQFATARPRLRPDTGSRRDTTLRRHSSRP
jgi:hypothetical protein